MAFLYESMETLAEYNAKKEMPKYIEQNLNPRFKLRPYQIQGFENFITHFESDKCPKPTQTLFHMATGSGKTMMMAGLMIYLYKQGYRNFLFFVNLSTIVQKTKDNFLNSISNKYLFAEEIMINGEKVKIKEVSNFQNTDDNAINICFTTTQGLHSDMWLIKENAISFDDFQNQKVVLISDEAHHLNADTKKKLNKQEAENYHSWEQTVKYIFNANRDNVLLEFTATCDLENRQIKAEYENKIIFDYPLYKFRQDKYSKEIKTMRSDVTIMERAISAIILSQYRLKIFEDNKIAIKPVVLFKAAKIDESKKFMSDFIEKVSNLTGSEIEQIFSLITNETMMKAHNYFITNGISFNNLAEELKEAFNEEHCISANDNKESIENQLILNSLEDKNNPYRAVFEVKKLDEGWDVLNLFDIVRLYETRQSSGNKISAVTVSEAQLIGRGSRYCPFQINDEQDKYKRKYDDDLDNPLRICEELFYHCQNDSRYITELHNALREIGLGTDKTVTKKHKLKDEFKQHPLYQTGYVFINERQLKSRTNVNGLLPSVRNKVYSITLDTRKNNEDTIMEDHSFISNSKCDTYIYRTSFKEISTINYAAIQKALCKHNVYKFNTLKSYFPNLKSTREFITSDNYIGGIELEINSRHKTPPLNILHLACVQVLGEIANKISSIEEVYEGTTEFKAKNIRDTFKDKVVNYTVSQSNDGVGISQNDPLVSDELKINLLEEDWYAFEDNYGTNEEKAFVAYFKRHIDEFKKKYDEVFLVRNERQVAIYSFDGGERFEPDYLLFLHSNKVDGYEQLQIFIEPKGTHLLPKDSWKENFLLELESKASSVTKFVDDNSYTILGFHFFNRQERQQEFDEDMRSLLV